MPRSLHGLTGELVRRHWAHLPVSIWNDKPYDNEAIFTGSASVIDGKPFIVCKSQRRRQRRQQTALTGWLRRSADPGLCNKNDYPPSTAGGKRDGCITGTNYAQAVPANPKDPLYTNCAPFPNPI